MINEEQAKYFIKISEMFYSETGEKTLEYKGNTFGYKTYDREDCRYAYVVHTYIHNHILSIPDEIDGYPVYVLRLASDVKDNIIDKIILGKSLLKIVRLTKVISSLNEIVIPENYEGPNFVISDMLAFRAYSKCSIKLTDKRNSLIITNQYITSKDEKELLSLTTDESVKLPDNIEVIKNNARLDTFKKSSTIEWPKSLIKIEDSGIKMTLRSTDFGRHHPFPKTLEYVSACTFRHVGNMTDLDCYPAVIVDNTLYIASNVKDFSDEVLFHLRCKEAKGNKHIIFENDLLLSKDRTILFKVLGKEGITNIIIPKEVKTIRNHALDSKRSLKTIVLLNNDENLIKQIGDKYKIVINNDTKKDSDNSKGLKIDSFKNGCKISECDSRDKLTLDIKDFGNYATKVFKLTTGCKNIKNLIIPEGVTDLEVDPLVYVSEMNLKTLELPSTMKLMKALEDLTKIHSLDIVIFNHEKVARWSIHKVPFILACRKSAKMNYGVFANFEAYFGFDEKEDFSYSVINEITYVKKYDEKKLFETDEAYYYLYKKDEYCLLKVKEIDNYIIPATVNGKPLTKLSNFCFTKLKGKVIGNNSNIDFKIE